MNTIPDSFYMSTTNAQYNTDCFYMSTRNAQYRLVKDWLMSTGHIFAIQKGVH